ncbi:tautomerase family protein [Vreelandella zhaodongensis]
MPIVTIQQFPRDHAQKRELAKRITDAFCDVYGTDPVRCRCFFKK